LRCVCVCVRGWRCDEGVARWLVGAVSAAG
jgi:hypothetical protein